MKRTIVAKIKDYNGEVETSFSPEGFDLSVIENLFSDECSNEDREVGEEKVLQLAEQTARGRGDMEDSVHRAVLITYKMVTT